MATSLIRFFLVSLLVFPFLSCGSDEGFNDDVKFQIFPETPFIILNDTTIGAGDDTLNVPAPWFLAGFAIQNNHPTYELRVPSLSIKYEGTVSGTVQEGEATLDADAACPFFTSPPRTLYAVVAAGGETSVGDADCNNVNDPTDADDVGLFYFGELPNSDNTAYFVTVTLEGYMFDNSNLTDPIKGRVRKILTFSTQ